MKISPQKHAHLTEIIELALLRTRAQGSSLFGKSVNARTDELLARVYQILDIEVEESNRDE